MTRVPRLLHVALAAGLLASAAGAQTVTVTTTDDVIDIDSFNGTLADLPGPDGVVSLSEAMIATNNTPGHQTVAFAIPASQLGWIGPQYDGIAVLRSSIGYFWRANDEVTLDGTTQTAFAGDTNPFGAEVLLFGPTFYLNADSSTLRGFHSSSVQSGGASCLLEDNTGSMNITLFGGGGTFVRNNGCGTIKIDRSDGNVVIGNTTSRVRVLGGSPSQPAVGNFIGGPQPSHRNFITGYGSYNSEGLPAGAAIQLAWTQGTRIENNFIGTTPDGLGQGNLACTMGISFESGNHDVSVRGNLIAGILGHGTGPHHAGQLFGWALYFWGSTTDIRIEGNTIGLDANGDPTLGSVWGVHVDNYSGYSVDGISLVDNVIAGHLLDGVRVGPTADMRLSRNAIYDNGWLGIDLIGTDFADGVSPNDALDADQGGSGVQNFPLLSAATRGSGTIQVVGELHSSPLDSFTIELFASPAPDPTGHGEGQVFLGSTGLSTDAAGNAAFVLVVPASAPTGWSVTATATLEPLGATSEFAPCILLEDGIGQPFCLGDGSVAPCPCGNEGPSGAAAGCVNSSGAGAALRALGSTSVAADDLVLALADLPGPSVALLFAGPSSVAPKPVGDGLLCVAAPLYRHPARAVGPTGSCAWGPGLSAWSQANLAPAGWIVPGSSWSFQVWFRDPAGPCGTTFGLSNGLQVDFTN